jgi:hypothetical protein
VATVAPAAPLCAQADEVEMSVSAAIATIDNRRDMKQDPSRVISARRF